jgi:acyl-coenzyme A synthetase/AMP-(fatty) acid ligase
MSFVLERIRDTVAKQPAAPACIVEQQVITYRAFGALVGAACRLLRERGIVAGERVALSMSQGPLTLVTQLALAEIGAVAVPMPRSLAPGLRAALCARFGMRRLIVSDAAAALPGLDVVVLESLATRTGDSYPTPMFAPEADTPMRVALTSGTTGEPKGILQTCGGFTFRMDRSFWATDAKTRVIPPNLNLTMTLMLVYGTLCAGGVVVFPRGYDFPHLLPAIAANGVTHMGFAPANLAAMLRSLPDESPAFPSLTHLRILGATPSPALLDAVRRKITPQVYLPYAMNELGNISLATPEMLAQDPHCAGRILPGARLEVLDASGRPAAAGESGELRIQVDQMPQGYLDNEAETRHRFRDGWFHPGDRGRITADGRVYIEGRSDEILNVGGHKVAPGHVEAMLEEHPQVREAAVLPERDDTGETRLVAAIVVTGALRVADLRKHASSRLGSYLSPARYVSVPSLPRTPTEKIRRNELAAWIRERGSEVSA